MSKTKETPADAPRWHTPTVWVSWLVLIAFTTLSAMLNRDHARMVTPDASPSLRNELIHAGLPVALVVALALAELIVLAGAHGAARVVALGGLAAMAVTVFAASYNGILSVYTFDNPTDPAAMRWSISAVPDLLMVTATVALVSLRQKAETRRGKVSATEKKHRWNRLNAIADATTGAAVAALSRRESPQVSPASPVHDAHHDAPRDAHHEPSVTQHDLIHDAPRDATVTHHEVLHDAVHEASHEAPRDSRRGPLNLDHAPSDVACRVVEQTTITQPVSVIKKVLEAALTGLSHRDIASRVSTKSARISPSTVGRIIAAARQVDAEPEPAPATLTAVG